MCCSHDRAAYCLNANVYGKEQVISLLAQWTMNQLLGSDYYQNTNLLGYSCVCYFGASEPPHWVSKSRNRRVCSEYKIKSALLQFWYVFQEKRFGGWKRQLAAFITLLLCPFSSWEECTQRQRELGKTDSWDSCHRALYQILQPVIEVLETQAITSVILSGAISNTTKRPAPQSWLPRYRGCSGCRKISVSKTVANTDLSPTIKYPLFYSKTKPESETLRYFYVAGGSSEKLQSWSNTQIGVNVMSHSNSAITTTEVLLNGSHSRDLGHNIRSDLILLFPRSFFAGGEGDWLCFLVHHLC